jgi:uncharacterized protein
MVTLWGEQATLLPAQARQWRDTMFAIVGTPAENPAFWSALSANSYLADLSGPIQLHHSDMDASVPVEFSIRLAEQIQAAGTSVESFIYAGDDHDLSASFDLAIQRSLDFFDYYLKPKG